MPLLCSEFQRHQRTYLLWPYRADNWRNNAVPVRSEIRNLHNAISHFEPVTVGYKAPHDLGEFAADAFEISYDDIWVRDTGPTFVRADGRIEARLWGFNSWGGLLESYADDQKVAEQIASKERIVARSSSLVFEGGAYCTDGDGLVISTRECVFSRDRNPDLPPSEIEAELASHLGAREFLWLESGLLHDETGGHIDNVCFFADASTLLVARSNNTSDSNFFRSNEIFETLATHPMLRKKKIKVHPIPLPLPLEISEEEAGGFAVGGGAISRAPGTLMCASYANSYVVNGGIIVPTFGSPEDDEALAKISETVRGRRVIGVRSRELVLGGGAIHCVTKEIPAVDQSEENK